MLSEPLVHFLLLGGMAFVLYRSIQPVDAKAPKQIVVDQKQVAALVSEYRRVWQRPPNDDELQKLIDEWVRDEVLYREGLAAGLDSDDSVVRRRVVQKMKVLAEGMAVDVPGESELEVWFAKHAKDYETQRGGIPEFSSVRQHVERDFMRQRTEHASEGFYRTARARYRVRVVPGAIDPVGATLASRQSSGGEP